MSSLKFASDDITEDINEILPKQEIINLDQDEKRLKLINVDRIQDTRIRGENSPVINNNTNNKSSVDNSVIVSSFKIEYDKWAAASQQATTTSFYSNQILYTEQGIVAWICKCCEYLRMKVGDGYSTLIKQPFREG